MTGYNTESIVLVKQFQKAIEEYREKFGFHDADIREVLVTLLEYSARKMKADGFSEIQLDHMDRKARNISHSLLVAADDIVEVDCFGLPPEYYRVVNDTEALVRDSPDSAYRSATIACAYGLCPVCNTLMYFRVFPGTKWLACCSPHCYSLYAAGNRYRNHPVHLSTIPTFAPMAQMEGSFLDQRPGRRSFF